MCMFVTVLLISAPQLCQLGPPMNHEKVCVCNVFAYSRSALRTKLICWDKNEVFGKQIV